MQKINDTAKCIEVFKEFKKKKGNKEIFEYIKTLSPEQIDAFKSYSKVFSSIIELDRNENSALNIFDQVNKIITNAKFLFLQEIEIFSYNGDNKITMEDLVHLKNKINVIKKEAKKKEKDKKEKKDYLEKTMKMKKINYHLEKKFQVH